jgi:hypothetical protein
VSEHVAEVECGVPERERVEVEQPETAAGLRSVIDDRLRGDLGVRYDRHSAQSVGTDKLTVTFIVRASTHADAIRSAGLAAATLAELLVEHAAGVDLSGVALVVRAQ